MRDNTFEGMIAAVEQALEGRAPALAELHRDDVEPAHLGLNRTNQC